MSEKSSWTVATNNDCFEIKNHDGVLVGKFKNIEAVLSHFVLTLQQNHQLKLLLEAIQLTEREQEVLHDLSLKMDITPNRVIVQALRVSKTAIK